MNISRHLPAEDLALFALQLVEGDELQAALSHLEQCEECRYEVARLQGDLALYALAQSEPQAPSAAARDRLLEAVAHEKKAAPRQAAPIRRLGTAPADPNMVQFFPSTPEPEEEPQSDVILSSRSRGMFQTGDDDTAAAHAPSTARAFGSMLGWAGWAIAAGMAVVAGMQFRERQNMQTALNSTTAKLTDTRASLGTAEQALHALTDAGAMQVALHVMVNGKPEPPQPEGRAAYLADKGSLVFIADHLAPLPSGKTYELWILPPATNGEKAAPVPAGTFHPDERGVATLMLPEIPKGQAAEGFGVTVENDGGSPVPTSPVILAGT